VNCAKT